MLVRCSLEAEGGTLQIICDNESEAKILKDKNRPLMIREALAERFNLSTPPNLAFIVKETYNKPAAKTSVPASPATPPISATPPTQAPPPAQTPTDPLQMGWDDYAQGVEDETASPF